MSELDVQGFEQTHGVILPDGFRQFLIQVGNGGPGPSEYGWPPLGEVPDDMQPREAQVWTDLPYIRQPFPFTQTWVWEGGDTSAEGRFDQRQHGALCIGNDGCAMYWFLVVTGPERGNVWMVCGEGLQPTLPKRDFLQWVEDWLDGTTEWWT